MVIFYFQYFSPIIFLWFLELIFLTLFPVIKSLLYNFVSFSAYKSLNFYLGEKADQNLVSLLWNLVMTRASCCAVEGFHDFKNLSSWQNTRLSNQIIPSACCVQDLSTEDFTTSPFKPKDNHCTFVPTKYNSHWKVGCLPTLVNALSNHTSLIILVLIIVLTFEMIIVSLAVCLYLIQKTQRDRNPVQYKVVIRDLEAGELENRKRNLSKVNS